MWRFVSYNQDPRLNKHTSWKEASAMQLKILNLFSRKQISTTTKVEGNPLSVFVVVKGIITRCSHIFVTISANDSKNVNILSGIFLEITYN